MRKLITTSGAASEPTDEQIVACVADSEKEGFWLDIEAPDADDYRLLEDVLKFHPLTIEDIQDPNERPKLDEYAWYVFVVIFTAHLADDDVRFLEQHVYYSKRMAITVHHEPQPELDALRERIRKGPEITKGKPGFLLYHIVDTLVDAMFPTLDRLDETIDELQDRVITEPSVQVLKRIYDLKHTVIDVRRQLGAQRDLLQQLVARATEFHGSDVGIYYRDVYDHIVRQYETADSLRDLLTGTMDVYLSTVSNRQNATMKQLTVIASLFLPLTFLTGFFGMNFAFLVSRIGSTSAFGFGVGLMAVATAIQLWIFRVRRVL
jgi:magnesium transporter